MTNISWTTETWNPVVGCSIVSKGCTNCYAMRMANRLGANTKTPHYRGLTQKVNGNPVWTGRIAAAPDHVWTQPLRRRKPTTWFANSMGDLFHEAVPDEMIDRAFAIMALCPRHSFQVLTKRPERMRRYLSDDHEDTDLFERIADIGAPMVEDGDSAHDMLLGIDWPLPNVWMGTSVEDQATADARIPPLLATPAALRFISAEPLLGPVDLTTLCTGHYFIDAMRGIKYHDDPDGVPHYRSLPAAEVLRVGDRAARLDFVIVGGESGPGARPMHPAWARSLRDQCAAASVPFHFKQVGAWQPVDRWIGPDMHRMTAIDPDGNPVAIDVNPDDIGGQRFIFAGKKAAGRHLDGVVHDAMPPHAEGDQ